MTNQPLFIYFSQLMDKTVIDKNGSRAGELYDIIVKPGQIYPQSVSLIIRKGFPNRKYGVVQWKDIQEPSLKKIKLAIDKQSIGFSEIHNNKVELTLRRDILDQQVVDTYNHKVIRINDIHLLVVDNLFMVAHVDISVRGMIRRLGFEKPVDMLVRFINRNADYLKTEHLISWKHIQPLSINPVSMTIKVNVPQQQLSNIPAADLGEIYSDLTTQHKIALFKTFDLATKAKLFMGVDFKTQKLLIGDLPPQEAVAILNQIPSDEVTDFLEQLPKDRVNELLGLMESKQSRKLASLLGYSNDSAGGLMATEFMAFNKSVTVESVLSHIKERAFKVEPVQYVYIVDENNRLLGSTNFRRLMTANPQDPVEKTAFPKTYFVRLDSSVKEIAYLMDKYKYYVIPVVDENHTLQGIVTVDDILSQVISFAWRRLRRIKILPKQ